MDLNRLSNTAYEEVGGFKIGAPFEMKEEYNKVDTLCPPNIKTVLMTDSVIFFDQAELWIANNKLSSVFFSKTYNIHYLHDTDFLILAELVEDINLLVTTLDSKWEEKSIQQDFSSFLYQGDNSYYGYHRFLSNCPTHYTIKQPTSDILKLIGINISISEYLSDQQILTLRVSYCDQATIDMVNSLLKVKMENIFHSIIKEKPIFEEVPTIYKKNLLKAY